MRSMKLSLLIVTALATPVLAFGQNATFCYQATQKVPQGIPTVFCLESIEESGLVNVLQIGSKDGSMPSSANIFYLSRHNEDRYRFLADSTLINNWDSICSYGMQASLRIEGESQSAHIDAGLLKVSVHVTETNDTCHFYPSPDVIPYVRVTR